MEHYTPLGYGSSGVVVGDNMLHSSHALKLYSAPADEAAILREGSIQAAAARALSRTLRVPSVHTVTRRPVVFEDVDYIAGIYMDPVPGHEAIDGEQVHIPLGANLEHDEWYPCGFFPTIATLEKLLEFKRSRYTVQTIAYTMGKAHRTLLDAGIIPDHVKFLYGADDRIWMIGFRHCRMGHMDLGASSKLAPRTLSGTSSSEDPIVWLNDRRREVEPYAPREGQRGRPEYLAGFLDSPTG
jgi:hypothetical protein